MALITLWYPIYGLQSLVLLATALVSLLTAILIWPQIPDILSVPTPWQLEKKNQQLQEANKKLIDAENKARSILEAAPDPMLIVNKDRVIIFASARVVNLFGYTPEEACGIKINQIIPDGFKFEDPESDEFFIDTNSNTVSNKLNLYALHRDGSKFPVEISLSPLQDPLTGLVFLAAIRDVSDKKRAEERLQYTNKLEQLNIKLQTQRHELIRSNEELDSFCYIASHDLKEPLRGIHHFSKFLVEDYSSKLDEDGRDMLLALPKMSKQLNMLIDSLLEYSRLGRVDLAYAETDLNELASDVIVSLEAFIKIQKGNVLIRDKLPIIFCDRIRVSEIFRNLICNGIKYNESSTPTVEIGVEPKTNVIYVKDNGIGIKAKHHEAIFKIFKRLHSKEKYFGGTGVGLTIVKKIIERHGGVIWVKSTPNQGSCFYFTLRDGDTHDTKS